MFLYAKTKREEEYLKIVDHYDKKSRKQRNLERINIDLLK